MVGGFLSTHLFDPKYALMCLVALVSLATVMQVNADDTGTVTATIRVNPLDITVSATPLELAVGDSFRLNALVQNKGDTRLTNVRASSLFDTSGLRLRGSSGRNLGSIGPESTKLVRWRFKALESGNYILVVSVEALERETGTLLHAQGSVMVVVVD